ncbi:MAG: carboxylating nicotinate-nucleotide diphosphorylase [Saprospiraceae bacterium]|nr:carboxylating nicotinate-nucleotide diphosphorylase [Bacteroidia bacterium]NNF21171.1 carboxylating nicotinate-nucleotide diphosphorylase [Saprospiraceae bacterium]NNK89701.1 carboxylating nicotinate-nucleotide diphosphorylase [Saprospiraceae bacterium]
MEGIKTSLLNAFIDASLREDIKDGDHTSLACIPADARDTARLIVKDKGVIAGVDFAEHVFKRLDPECRFERLINDGSDVKYGDIAFTVETYSRTLLKGERLVLNTMQRLSGVSSLSRKFSRLVEDLPVTILDTRKTTPLMRFLEKWAVRIGGCTNYRDGLYDWIMIKDNHIDASGNVQQAIRKVKDYLQINNKDLGITVEVRDIEELKAVMEEGGVTRIMLDNFDLDNMRTAVELIGDRFECEASGGVNIGTVRAIAETGVDFISVGALTHSAGSLDMSLKIVK